jgi:hypothetical protein
LGNAGGERFGDGESGALLAGAFGALNAKSLSEKEPEILMCLA